MTIKQTIWLDNCNEDVFQRLKTIFQYETIGYSDFANQYHVMNEIFKTNYSEFNPPSQTWVEENLTVNSFSGKIEEINIATATARILIVSSEIATNLTINLLAELTFRSDVYIKSDVFLSGIYNSLLHEVGGVMVGKLDEVTYFEYDMSGYDNEALNDSDESDLELLGTALEDFKTEKYHEFLGLI